jgi:hypothetical protein
MLILFFKNNKKKENKMKKLAMIMATVIGIFFFAGIAGATELIVTEAGTQRYQAIKEAMMEQSEESAGMTFVEYLSSKGFSLREIALAAGYFLLEIQEGSDEKVTVFSVEGIYGNNDKRIIESILVNLFQVEYLKYLSETFKEVDPKKIPDLQKRKEFVKNIEELENSFRVFKKFYLDNYFTADWTNYVALSLGEDIERTFGVNPNSFDKTEWPEWPETP